MTSYLPRFRLRRALIGIALLALFLGWLRPDRAKFLSGSITSMGTKQRTVEFRPFLYPAVIAIERWEAPSDVRWNFSVRTTK
jgi:hypothetical protein